MPTLFSARSTKSAAWGPIDAILFADAADMAGMISLTGKIRSVAGVASVDTRIVVG